MKKFILLFSFNLVLTFCAFSQWKGEHDINKPYAEGINLNGEITQIKQSPRNTGRVIGTVGAVYTSNDLNQLPTRNINKISSMTLGVQANGGQEPIFKGTFGGTAYFVDGIRVRSGALAVAGFTY